MMKTQAATEVKNKMLNVNCGQCPVSTFPFQQESHYYRGTYQANQTDEFSEKNPNGL